MFAFFAVTAVTKFSSDGLILHNICYVKRSYNRMVNAGKLLFCLKIKLNQQTCE